jgi:medium-chain acyl-[acyl-carrier-protein] hydrolase
MTNPTPTGRWFECSRRNSNPALRLFCLPYAGGGAQTFRGWQEELPAGVSVCAAHLPGRENRLLEKPYTDFAPLVRVITEEFRPYLDKPFALFGHSMGAMLCFELAYSLREEYGVEPLHLFVSGRRAPQLPDSESPTYNLPEPEFLAELSRLNGTPKEALEHPELMRLLLPLLRADFELVQTYRYTDRPPLNVPLTALGGIQDVDVSREQVEAWRVHTAARFVMRMLPGDHFFINTARPLLLQVLSMQLNQILMQLPRR